MINQNLDVKLNGFPIETNGKNVALMINGSERTIDLDWMYGISLYNIILPSTLDQDIIFKIVFKPIDLKSHKLYKSVIPVFVEPVYVKKDYRLLAICPSYAVSKDGDIYSIISKTNKINNVKNNLRNKYISISLKNKTHALHRIVALTWLENNDFITRPLVNHLDGNKLNCRADNLEWCSFYENNNHAIDNNFNLQANQFLLYDTELKVEILFPSVGKLSRYIGLKTIPYLESKVSKFVQYVIQKRYIVKHIANTDDWSDLEYLIDEQLKSRLNTALNCNLLEAKNITTNEIIVGNTNKLSSLTGVKQSVISNMSRIPKQDSKYGFIFRNPYWLKWDDIKVNLNMLTAKKLVVVNTQTNIKTIYSSINEVAKVFNCDFKVIRHKVVTGKEYKLHTFQELNQGPLYGDI